MARKNKSNKQDINNYGTVIPPQRSETESREIIPETPPELAFDYHVEKLLGEGSYGKTYLAKDLHTGELVAIKELKTVNDFKSLDLFKREAEVLESLSVAGVPRFYKSIIPEGNLLTSSCYIIQEYVMYPSIQTELNKSRKFSEKETAEIMMGIVEILKILQTEYVPAIIHRDIKPSNIMYEKRDDKYRIYLIDFGAVANPQKRGSGSTIAGTLGYMGPEQLLGDCYIQSDFYSLGATALHMLTGVAPYKMDSKGFELDIGSAIEKYAPRTSEHMRTLLEWLMESRYENRPSSAIEVMRAIKCVQEHLDPKKSLETDDPQTAKSARRQKIKENPYVMVTDNRALIRVERDNWRWTYCTVWKMNIHNCRTVYEYTFVLDGHTWGGAMFKENVIQLGRGIPSTFPFKCFALYDKDDPRQNLIFISGSKPEADADEPDSFMLPKSWIEKIKLNSLNHEDDLSHNITHNRAF